MARLRVEQYVVGQVMTNCYFAVNEDTLEVLVIDPGDGAAGLIEKIRQEKLVPRAVLLTHGHFDHAMAAGEIAREFQIPVYAEEHEKETLENPDINLCGMLGRRESYHADKFVKDGEELSLAGFDIKVMFTPGHTKGGCCYYMEKEQAVFPGTPCSTNLWGERISPGAAHRSC